MPDSYRELNYHAQLLRHVAAGNLTLEEADRLAIQRRREMDEMQEEQEARLASRDDGDRWDGLS